MRTLVLRWYSLPARSFITGGLTSPSRFKMRYTVDSPTDKLWWWVIQVASCRLLHSGDSLAVANTAASSDGLSLFQGTRVMAEELCRFPCSSRARHR